jgi:hypothetical protein
MKRLAKLFQLGAALGVLACSQANLLASSHMDAPLITLDDPANTTDVYAFVAQPGATKYLTVALAVYPHEEPGIGPNIYRFDDNVLYQIHVATGDADITAGTARYSYQFQFTTRYKTDGTILDQYLGVIKDIDDANQNLVQTYRVTRVDNRTSQSVSLGTGTVPPNNQGIATPYYNVGDSGENQAKDGVADETLLDRYTSQAVFTLSRGYRVFAGQRDDGFYGDINGIFDLLNLRSAAKAQDAQGGFNVHTIVLQIPVSEIGGDMQQVGVYATTSRRRVTTLHETNKPLMQGDWVQIARQGNPLFNEALVALKDKDLYGRTSPDQDRVMFLSYATNPELATLINAILFGGKTTAIDTNRRDIAAIFIPDLIKVDLSTERARLAGSGSAGSNPDDAGFSRLGIFGNDTLTSKIQEGFGKGALPGGWPNGRRFGDDPIDIAVTALLSDLRPNPPVIAAAAGDNVDKNDAVYSKVMPYAATPHNGRNHRHP